MIDSVMFLAGLTALVRGREANWKKERGELRVLGEGIVECSKAKLKEEERTVGAWRGYVPVRRLGGLSLIFGGVLGEAEGILTLT